MPPAGQAVPPPRTGGAIDGSATSAGSEKQPAPIVRVTATTASAAQVVGSAPAESRFPRRDMYAGLVHYADARQRRGRHCSEIAKPFVGAGIELHRVAAKQSRAHQRQRIVGIAAFPAAPPQGAAPCHRRTASARRPPLRVGAAGRAVNRGSCRASPRHRTHQGRSARALGAP